MGSEVLGGFMSCFRMTGFLYHTGIFLVMAQDFGYKILTAPIFHLASVTSMYRLIYLQYIS